MTSPIDLCTVADVKSYLGESGSTADTVIQAIITAASQFAIDYCSRNFIHASYTNEVFNGTGGRVQVLPQGPVTAVTAVTIGNVVVPLSTGPTVSGYTFDDQAVYLRGFVFCMDLQNVAISYDAGYTAIPADLSNAVVEMVVQKFKGKNSLGTLSRGIAGETIAFSPSDMPKGTKSVFNMYQRASI